MNYSKDLDIIKLYNDYITKNRDWLNDFPYLTLIGRMAGLDDDQIRKVNEKMWNNSDKLTKIYE